MEYTTEIIWIKNRVPFLILGALLIPIPISLIIYPLILPKAPTWAVTSAFVFYLLIVTAFSKYFVFRIGIGEGRVVFKKAIRKLEVKRSEVIALDVSPPFSSFDIQKPWYQDRNRRLRITLQGKRNLDFNLIEVALLEQIQRALKN